MFCAVDADQHEFIFHRECRRFAAIETNTDLACGKNPQGGAGGKVSQRAVVVELDDQF